MEAKRMNDYIYAVYQQFVVIRRKDFKKSLRVFDAVLKIVLDKMNKTCKYFSKYCKDVKYAGSMYDGTKVKKIDEIDMDIEVNLPNFKKYGLDDVILENGPPGYVKMKTGAAFDNLVTQNDWEDFHKVTHEWRDRENYLVQNEFRTWFYKLVNKALNDMFGQVTADQTTYVIKCSESGPACTLNVRNESENFILDVDLVPVIMFTLPRWPDGYRQLDCACKGWLVVPKPNEALDCVLQNRCWRLSFPDIELEILQKPNKYVKETLQLVKKLRDSLQLKKISSYYIKTLFLWEAHENKKSFSQGTLISHFLDMVIKLRIAINKKEIPYFWNDKFNLIEHLTEHQQIIYVDRLRDVIRCLRANCVDQVMSFVLTEEELDIFQPPDAKHIKKATTWRAGIPSDRAITQVKPESQMHLEAEQPTRPESSEPAKPFPVNLINGVADIADAVISPIVPCVIKSLKDLATAVVESIVK